MSVRTSQRNPALKNKNKNKQTNKKNKKSKKRELLTTQFWS
jgi:hypothetical protein